MLGFKLNFKIQSSSKPTDRMLLWSTLGFQNKPVPLIEQLMFLKVFNMRPSYVSSQLRHFSSMQVYKGNYQITRNKFYYFFFHIGDFSKLKKKYIFSIKLSINVYICNLADIKIK